MSNATAAAVAPVREVTVIEAGRRDAAGLWREVWGSRELLYFLVWRDLKVRYKQTLLGAAWAVLQPFATMVVFSIFFGRLAGMPSDGVPYPVFAYAALVPWTYFSAAVTAGAASLAGSRTLIAKVYFPRVVIPLAAVITPLIDAAIALVILGVLMIYFGVLPGAALLWLPVFVLLAVLVSAALAVLTAALGVKYRDIRYLLPFLVQFWLFVTPVVYPSSLVPERWRTLYSLNPMATVVDGFRWTLVGTPAPGAMPVAASIVAVIAVSAVAIWYFRRAESSFADVI